MMESSIAIRVPEFRLVPVPGVLEFGIPERFIKKEKRTWIWNGPFEGIRTAVFKLYRKGSFSSAACRTFWTPRAQREYRALLKLQERGVACTEPVLWGHGKSRDHGRVQVLITREVPGSGSIRDQVRGRRLELDGEIISQVSDRAREMHRTGVYHGAFSWKNLLVGRSPGGGLLVHVADLARSLIFPRDIAGSRMADIDLLHFCSHMNRVLGKEPCRQFLRDYGLDARSAARILDELSRYDPENKRWRQRIRRLEFLMKSIFRRVARFRRLRSTTRTTGSR